MSKKTVLVSGGAGFIGSHVTVELLAAGYEVVVADNFSNCDRTCFEGVKKIDALLKGVGGKGTIGSGGYVVSAHKFFGVVFAAF